MVGEQAIAIRQETHRSPDEFWWRSYECFPLIVFYLPERGRLRYSDIDLDPTACMLW